VIALSGFDNYRPGNSIMNALAFTAKYEQDVDD
jgi:hypothetical protein